MISFEQSLREEKAWCPVDRSWTAFEDVSRQRLRGDGVHAHLIPLSALIGEPQDLSWLDAQAGPKMVAEVAGEGEFGAADCR